MLDNNYRLSYIRYTRRLLVTVITRLLGHSDYSSNISAGDWYQTWDPTTRGCSRQRIS
jgi:hypothetical protein